MTSLLEINYEKRKNAELFKSFEKDTLTNLSIIQNYIPIYDCFFELNDKNYNSINLNHEWYINNVESLTTNTHIQNVYKCEIKNKNTKKNKNKNLFFKMAPLLDPFKYIIGKYDVNNSNLFNLPKYDSVKHDDIHKKILNQNNSAYVDSLFFYLSSMLIYKYNFQHGVDFYGSFLAIKKDFEFDIIDELEYLNNSDFFKKNKNKLFQVEDYSYLFKDDNKLKPIKIDHTNTNSSQLSIKTINDEIFDDIFNTDLNL